MQYEFLDKIDSPKDLKSLPERDIPALCSEIRSFLIENVERTGGHLASNLGVTELSVAIHRVFDSPRDHIIFDVGHQSYVHKLITGRREAFSELRRTGGLSGFTSMRESEHDAFGAGHSSTSVSAALGYAEADRLVGSSAITVAVLGDGAFTGGMAHEALNNCDPELPLVIILNDNGMSISVNKGRFAGYLSRFRASRRYIRMKQGLSSAIGAVPLVGKPFLSLLRKTKRRFRNLFLSSNYFEDLGLYYIGPIDGNDYKKTERALRVAKELGKCVIVHVKTVKGKGYAPAERFPDDFHSVYTRAAEGKPFNKLFGEKLVELAKRDEKIVAVTAAMGIGTGLSEFEKQYPERYFDVGIAEAHAATFAAGLAANGLKPFLAIYSTFLQRAYDNLIHDVALQGLAVRIMIDRAGIAVGDGATHHGIFDVAFISHIPELSLYAPVCAGSLSAAIELAAEAKAPVAVRYANKCECEGVAERFYPQGDFENFGVRADFVRGSVENIFVTYGSIISNVMKAEELLASRGVSVGIILLEKLKPYREVAEQVLEYLPESGKLVFVEEGIKSGGAALCLKEALSELGVDFSHLGYDVVAIDDNFASPTAPCDIFDYLGMSPEKLAAHFEACAIQEI